MYALHHDLTGNGRYGIARADLRQLLLTVTLVLPAVMSYDALVSALRFYSKDQLEEIISKVPGHDKYIWDTSRFSDGPEVSILLARPSQTDQ